MNDFRNKNGFTLIEILVVVVIVAILMGGTFRLMGIASESSKRADTVSRLERIHNALGAYYAEYGQYPPSATVNKGGTTPKYIALSTCFKMPVPSGSPSAGQGTETDPPEDMVFGLPGYLVPKITAMYKGTATGSSSESEGEDRSLPEKNKLYLDSIGSLGGWGNVASWKTAYNIEKQDPRTQVCNRWLPQIAGILDPGLEGPPHPGESPDNGTPFIYRTFKDGWRQEFVYECRPPFQSYRLWSVGPDNRTYFQRYYDSTDGDSTSPQVFAISNGSLGPSSKRSAYSQDSDCNRDDIEMTDR